jgi:hypothetical protein
MEIGLFFIRSCLLCMLAALLSGLQTNEQQFKPFPSDSSSAKANLKKKSI